MEKFDMSFLELGELVKISMTKTGKWKRFQREYGISDDEYFKIERGACEDISMYIKALAFAFNDLYRRKINPNNVPDFMPRDYLIAKLRTGESNNFLLYKKLLPILCVMPNSNNRKRKKYKPKRIKIVNNRPEKQKIAKKRHPRYGEHSQITRKEWGSPSHPGRI